MCVLWGDDGLHDGDPSASVGKTQPQAHLERPYAPNSDGRTSVVQLILESVPKSSARAPRTNVPRYRLG